MKEHLLTPFVPGRIDGLRAHLMISSFDMDKFHNLPGGNSGQTIEVTDNITGNLYRIRRAACGLGCFCAAEIVED